MIVLHDCVMEGIVPTDCVMEGIVPDDCVMEGIVPMIVLFVFQPRVSRWFTLCGRWTSAPSVRCETRTSSTWYVLKEGNVLFNDAFNTFYLPLYGVRHMVKDHSDSGRGNLLLPHRLLFPISSKGSFICTIPQIGWHIPQPLLHQLWSTGWNEK